MSGNSVLPEVFAEISVLVRSRYPILYVTSHEEERVLKHFKSVSDKIKKTFYSWSITTGLIDLSADEDEISNLEAFCDPLDILEHINNTDENAIFVLKDFHCFLEDFTVIRKLRDLYHSLKLSRKNLVLLAPVLQLPEELKKEVTVIDIPLPESDEFKGLIKDIDKGMGKNSVVNLSQKDLGILARAAHGLTLSEAENVFSKTIVSQKKLSLQGLEFILSEKKQIVRKSGILEFYPTSHQMGELGGFASLKMWLEGRGRALFSESARRYGLPSPKGILLLGPPGTGKSLTAKIVSNQWKLPLLKLDFGKIFSGLVGSSEENMRQALKTAEALSPTVLWVDEIEKGIAGGKTSSSDGGTASRVFGSLLTWMQENKSTVFVIATANDISKLPPELLRKGRLDEIFFLDLPNESERKEIFRIHLRRKKRDPLKYQVDVFAKNTEGFTGAEIEQVINDALFKSFYQKKELNNENIISAIKSCIPLSRTYKEELDSLREWARLRARKAS